MEKSLIHIYTGDGKGKTTCAFGLAIRCAGNGYTVKIIQFLKTDDTGEVAFLNSMDKIQVYRFETPHGFTCDMSESEKEKLKEQADSAVRFAQVLLENCDCDMLVLDEIICAYKCNLISKEQIMGLIEKCKNTEMVLTGRDAPDWLIKKADYVTKMEKIKHPYEKSIEARKGIEF